MSQPSARPLIKCPGGKTRLLPEILSRLPDKIATYYEPMVGGGAVFFALHSAVRFQSAVLGDFNQDVTSVLLAVRDRPEELIQLLQLWPNSKRFFAAARAMQPHLLSDVTRGARAIYLNKTCFPPGAKLLMEDESTIDIDQARVGDRLWGGKTIRELVRRKFEGRMLSVTVQGLPSPARMTEDHPVLRIPRAKGRFERRSDEELMSLIELVPASRLEVRDIVLLPRAGKIRKIDWRRFWPGRDTMGPGAPLRTLAPDDVLIGRFLGYYLADGYSRLRDVPGPRNGRGGQVVITGCSAVCKSTTGKTDMISDLLRIGRKVFDVEGFVKTKGGRSAVVFSSSHLARFLERLVPGQTHSLRSAKRHTKRLSAELMMAGPHIQAAILCGWFVGDGSLRSGRDGTGAELAGTSVIPELARQICRLAFRCGLRPAWRVYYHNGLPTQVVTLSIGPEISRLGFTVAEARRSSPRRRILGRYIGARVTRVGSAKVSEDVFNVEVGGDHLICCDGIMSHNCFNGLMRYNQSGQFNAPFGYYERPTICDADNIRAANVALRDCKIYWSDFATTVRTAERGDAVYFDPPYVPVGGCAKFTEYTPGGFSMQDQERLAMCFRKLAQNGVAVLLSNSDTPEARKLYKGFKIERVSARRNINCKAEGRAPVGEILVSANCP